MVCKRAGRRGVDLDRHLVGLEISERLVRGDWRPRSHQPLGEETGADRGRDQRRRREPEGVDAESGRRQERERDVDHRHVDDRSIVQTRDGRNDLNYLDEVTRVVALPAAFDAGQCQGASVSRSLASIGVSWPSSRFEARQ